MHGFPSPTMGRGMLLFAVIIGSFGLYLLATRQWLNGGLFAAIGVFMGCYGTLMRNQGTRWDKPLLLVGLIAGVVAFGLAIKLTGMSF